MCDSIANGGYIPAPAASCPPANVIIASNILDTNGNVICGNIISQDGTFTGNLYVAGQIVGAQNYSSINIAGIANLTTVQSGTIQAGFFIGDGSNLSSINAANISGPANFTNLYVANSVTTTNLFFQNSILNTNLPTFNTAQGTWGSSANVASVTVDQYGRVSGASNIAISSSQWTGTPPGPIYYQNFVGIGSSATPSSNLQVTGNIYASNSVTTPNLYFTNTIQATNLPASGVTAGPYGSASNVAAVTVDQYGRVTTASNISISSSQWTTINGNVAYQNGVSIGTLSNPPNGSNLLVLGTANIETLNVTTLTANSAIIFGPATLNVYGTSNLARVTASNLTVSSNIIPGATGNTYVLGNLVVAGNVFSSLGNPLGTGGGFYMSLPNDIAVQPGYNGPTYGQAYPLSVGLSNGFTINGTSSLITVTGNGNFKFNTAGPYILNAVFNGSDNITGLAVGSNVADIHGQDQDYLYRYTTFVSQNPTEVIEIPINVSNTSLYYYLDLFKVDGGTIYSSNTGSGGTWLTIAPLTGGGLATGGPGGTPGTQWISSGSNIYFPNSVGVGAVNPGYKLDVVGDIHATGNVYAAQRVLTNQSTTYTATALDYYIGINGTGVTVNLPQGSTLPIGKTYVIKDESGLAATNHITVSPYSGNLIDGQASLILVINYLAVTLLWTGAIWSIV